MSTYNWYFNKKKVNNALDTMKLVKHNVSNNIDDNFNGIVSQVSNNLSEIEGIGEVKNILKDTKQKLNNLETKINKTIKNINNVKKTNQVISEDSNASKNFKTTKGITSGVLTKSWYKYVKGQLGYNDKTTKPSSTSKTIKNKSSKISNNAKNNKTTENNKTNSKTTKKGSKASTIVKKASNKAKGKKTNVSTKNKSNNIKNTNKKTFSKETSSVITTSGVSSSAIATLISNVSSSKNNTTLNKTFKYSDLISIKPIKFSNNNNHITSPSNKVENNQNSSTNTNTNTNNSENNFSDISQPPIKENDNIQNNYYTNAPTQSSNETSTAQNPQNLNNTNYSRKTVYSNNIPNNNQVQEQKEITNTIEQQAPNNNQDNLDNSINNPINDANDEVFDIYEDDDFIDTVEDTSNNKKKIPVAPIIAGVGALSATGVGVKIYKDKKDNNDLTTDDESFANENKFWTDEESNVIHSEKEMYQEEAQPDEEKYYKAIDNDLEENNKDTWDMPEDNSYSNNIDLLES